MPTINHRSVWTSLLHTAAGCWVEVFAADADECRLLHSRGLIGLVIEPQASWARLTQSGEQQQQEI